MAAFAAAACLLLTAQPAHCARRHVQRRATLEEMEQISEFSDLRKSEQSTMIAVLISLGQRHLQYPHKDSVAAIEST
jgi:hypothetical protein